MLLLIVGFCGNINQMSENKNIWSLTDKHHIVIGVGAALVAAAVIGSVSSANEMGGVDTVHASELPSPDLSTPPTAVHLEPVISNINSSEQSSNQTPSFKGKIIIKKPASGLLSAEKTVPTTSGLPVQKPIGVILPPLPVETTPSTIEKVSLHPELMSVPDNVKAIMDRDATYFPAMGCSGSLIRSRDGEAIGVLTAKHCYERDISQANSTRIIGSDGRVYMVTGIPIEVMTGPDANHLKNAGTVKELYVSPKDNYDTDVALGVLGGHTALEVLAAYNHNKLSDSELTKLTLGDRLYVSGWPVDQPNNGGNFERQNFPLTVLGKDTVDTVTSMSPDAKLTNENIDIIWTLVANSKDGSKCSPGESGGKAFIMEGGHSRAVGELVAFKDFTGVEGDINRQYFEDKYHISTIGWGAACAIALKTPSPSEGGDGVKLVTSAAEIPGYVNSLKDKALTEFQDPNYAKTILNGAINVAEDGTFNWKFRPVVFFEPGTGAAVLVSYNSALKDGVELDYIDNLLATPMFDAGDFFTTSGELGIFNGMNNSNGFVDKNSQVFGETYAKGIFPDMTSGKLILYNNDTQELYTIDLVSTAPGT